MPKITKVCSDCLRLCACVQQRYRCRACGGDLWSPDTNMYDTALRLRAELKSRGYLTGYQRKCTGKRKQRSRTDTRVAGTPAR